MESIHRRKRFSQFASTLNDLSKPIRILDLGGTAKYWRGVGYQHQDGIEITLLNIFEQQDCEPFLSVVGDARDLSRYSDGEFDVVYSNSVICCVGRFSDQERMANEIRRVGRRYWVQTPNHWFPIDWRTLFPFFHYLPERWQAFCLRHFRVGRYPKATSFAQSMRLVCASRNLTRRELLEMFPDGRLIAEKVMGITKSYVVARW